MSYSFPTSNSGGVFSPFNSRTVSINCTVCPLRLLGCCPPPVLSDADGVGKWADTAVIPGDFRRAWDGISSERWWSDAAGVGSNVTMVVRWVDFSTGLPVVRGRPMIPSAAFGVGKIVFTWFPNPAGWCFMLLPVFGASGIVSGVENTVLGDEEYPCPVVRGANVGSS